MPPVIGGLRDRLHRELEAFLRDRRRELITIDPGLVPAAQALESFIVRGGKRLRPAFAYWAYLGSGGVDQPGLTTAIASLELLHAGALIHDDVIDASETRRGEPAVHRRFADEHLLAGWAGQSEAFGRAAAILLGDLCLVWADQMFQAAAGPRGTGLEPTRLAAARPCYDAMRTEVMAGQYLDMLSQARQDESATQASKIARYKSAKYTVERPLLLGGALAGAGPELLEAFSGYGSPVGEAFQLRDDVLGVFGDPSQTGKPAGGDLREGKRTYLVAVALEHADPKQRATLRQLLGDPALDEAGVTQLRTIITDTGALQRTESRIAELTGTALGALERVRLLPEAEHALRALAAAAAQRAK
ncbi:MAG TPA: polyprenyl synthetase family protein [Micromonosporaceae bacterium]|nr:polyprenyl synthetase family protein [Micromonosporaceae bacterium]